MLASVDNKNLQTAIVQIQTWVLERLGIDYPEHKLGVLESKLSSLCRELKIESLEQLSLRLCDPGSDIQARVAHAVSTNHTAFFREPETFRRLAKEVLPAFQSASSVRVFEYGAQRHHRVKKPIHWQWLLPIRWVPNGHATT